MSPITSLPARLVTVLVAALAMLATGLPAGLSPAHAATPVFVNEIHYDNDGTDEGEFIEIAAPAGTDLSGWSVVLYNGNGGGEYDTRGLDSAVDDAGDGFGFGFVTIEYAANGIQNGSPDGVALVDSSGDVVQFLSYRGAFTAADGPAAGSESTDIGVAEGSSTPAGSSLQLGGSGSAYESFAWQEAQSATPGARNVGQSFGDGPADLPISLDCEDLEVAAGESAESTITASDPDETVTALSRVAVDPGTTGITLGDTAPADGPGEAASAQLSVADDVAAGAYEVTIEATNDGGDTATCTLTVQVLGVTSIGVVQGEVTDDNDEANSFESDLEGERVLVQGVIYERTLAANGDKGFFMQNTDETADGDPSTSDGIFVYMSDFDTLIGGYEPTVGDEVVVSGRVTEFFSLTQLSSASLVEVVRSDVDVNAEVPAFTVSPPDGLEAAYRYWERREGMRAQVPAGSVVQGGRDVFGGDDGELWAIPGDHPVAERTEPYTNRVFRDPHPLDDNPDSLFDDGNGYRFLMGSLGVKFTEGDASALIAPGRTFDTITNSPTGGVYFSFGKYLVQVTEQPELSSGANPAENAPPEEPDRDVEYSVAAANVENLYDFRDDPFDGCDFVGNDGCPGVSPPFNYVPASDEAYESLLSGLAEQIAVDLHAPDIVMVQEAEDQDICTVSDGALVCGDTDDADGKPDTLQELSLVIADEFGVAYDAAYDRDGADDRGITSAHLYRTDRVELLEADANDPILGSDSAIEYDAPALDYNNDVQNPKALNADLPASVVQLAEDNNAGYFSTDGDNVFTRAPQVARFRVWRTEIGASAYTDLWAVSNHFSSGPDRRVPQRTEQAAYNAAIVEAIEEADAGAKVVVGGDFNVFPRPDDPYGRGNPYAEGVTDQLAPLYETGMANLWDEVLAEAPASAYSYVFEGQAQTLDSIFVNDAIADTFVQARFAHINADWPADYDGDGARGVSDHDPLVARFLVVASLDDLRGRVAQYAADGSIDARRAASLVRQLDRIERFFDRETTRGAACGLLRAFTALTRAYTPLFIDQDAGRVLADTAEALSAVNCD